MYRSIIINLFNLICPRSEHSRNEISSHLVLKITFRGFSIMHSRTQCIRYIFYGGQQLMENMIIVGQNRWKQTCVCLVSGIRYRALEIIVVFVLPISVCVHVPLHPHSSLLQFAIYFPWVRPLCGILGILSQSCSEEIFTNRTAQHITYIQRKNILKKPLSKHRQLTQDWIDTAKWRSIKASNNVNKPIRHGVVGCSEPPWLNFVLVKFHSQDGSGCHPRYHHLTYNTAA